MLNLHMHVIDRSCRLPGLAGVTYRVRAGDVTLRKQSHVQLISRWRNGGS